jgi:hypothetical protein
MPRSGRRGTRVVVLCRMPRGPMRAAVVLLCLAMVLLPPAVVRGDACEEDMLRQTVYTNITSLPRLHPARVVLKNLVVGRCSLEQYQREKKEVLDLIAATQATIFLLGGESMISLAEEVDAGDVGVCTAEAENAGCEEAQVADIFSSLADDPSAPVKTYNGDLQLPAVLNSRCLSLSVPWPRIMPQQSSADTQPAQKNDSTDTRVHAQFDAIGRRLLRRAHDLPHRASNPEVAFGDTSRGG